MSWSCPIVSWRECTPKGDLSKSLINVVFVRKPEEASLHSAGLPPCVWLHPHNPRCSAPTRTWRHHVSTIVIKHQPICCPVVIWHDVQPFETKIKFPVLLTSCRLETLTVNVNWFVNRRKSKQTAFLRLRRREVKGERGKFLFLSPDFLFKDSGVVVLLSVSFLSIGFHSLPNKPWCKEI